MLKMLTVRLTETALKGKALIETLQHGKTAGSGDGCHCKESLLLSFQPEEDTHGMKAHSGKPLWGGRGMEGLWGKRLWCSAHGERQVRPGEQLQDWLV